MAKLLGNPFLSQLPFLILVNKIDRKQSKAIDVKNLLMLEFQTECIPIDPLTPQKNTPQKQAVLDRDRSVSSVSRKLSFSGKFNKPTKQRQPLISTPLDDDISISNDSSLSDSDTSSHHLDAVMFPLGRSQYRVQPCCALDGCGLSEGFLWLRKYFEQMDK